MELRKLGAHASKTSQPRIRTQRTPCARQAPRFDSPSRQRCLFRAGRRVRFRGPQRAIEDRTHIRQRSRRRAGATVVRQRMSEWSRPRRPRFRARPASLPLPAWAQRRVLREGSPLQARPSIRHHEQSHRIQPPPAPGSAELPPRPARGTRARPCHHRQGGHRADSCCSFARRRD
jgi:hypothetical protein